MAVSLCLRITDASEETILHVLQSLARHNVAVYRRFDLRPPWLLRWDPDAPSSTATLRDALLLQRAGAGSCGELAAAYAAWLELHGRSPVIELVSNGPDSWHAIVRAHGQVFDPAQIGVHRG